MNLDKKILIFLYFFLKIHIIKQIKSAIIFYNLIMTLHFIFVLRGLGISHYLTFVYIQMSCLLGQIYSILNINFFYSYTLYNKKHIKKKMLGVSYTSLYCYLIKVYYLFFYSIFYFCISFLCTFLDFF